MKRMLLFRFRWFVSLVIALVNISAIAQDISKKELRQATNYFTEKRVSYGLPVLKGARPGNPISSLGDKYCSDAGFVDIVPDNVDADAVSIEWTITTIVGSSEEHPDWAEYVGSGQGTVLRFYPDRVTSDYYNVPIYFEYIQKNNLGFIVDTEWDYTYVYQTPTTFNLSPATIDICAGENTTLTLSGSEAGMEYQLFDSGDNPIGFPVNGNGSPISFIVNTTETYRVEAVNGTESTCVAVMNGTSTVTVNPLPVPVASNGGDVCLGEDILLYADPDGMASYSWTNAGGTEVGTAQDITLSSNDYGVGTHTFTLTIEDVTTCVNSSTTSVTVTENPVVAPSYNAPVCDGGSLVISANASGGSGTYTTYTWTKGGVVIGGETGATLTIDPADVTDTGTYGVTVEDSNGCTSTEQTVIVTIQALPVPTINGDAAVTTTEWCEGEDITLTGGGGAPGATYSWLLPDGSTQNTAVLTINNADKATFEGTYTLTVTEGTCVSALDHNVVIHINPIALPTNGGDVCLGDDISLLGNPAGMATYTWTNAGGTVVGNTQNVTISSTPYGAGVHIFTLTIEDVNGCIGTATTSVTVYDNPVVAPSYNAPVCDGGSLVISANASGGSGTYTTYTWTKGGVVIGGETSATLTIDPADVTDNGTYGVTVEDSNGCTSIEQTVVVTIQTLPVPTINGDVAVTTTEWCEGEDITLTGGGGAPGATYSWLLPDGSTQNTAVLTINNADKATFEGTYTLTVTEGTCVSALDHNVVIHINPIASPTNGGDVCLGDDISLLGNPAGMATYTWTNAGGAVVGNTQNVTISSTPYGAGVHIFTLTIEDVNGCIGTATTSVTVYDNPVVAPSYNAPVCDGGSLVISANASGGSGTYTTYTWTKGGVVIGGETGATLTIDPADVTDTGTYGVTVEDSNGCTSTEQTVVVTIQALPVPTINGDAAVTTTEWCEDEDITLTGGGGAPGATYSWLLPDGSTQNTAVLTINNADKATYEGTYTLTVTEGTCVSALDHNVVIHINPIALPTNGGDVCLGDDISLLGNPAGMATYTWTNAGGTVVGNTQNVTISSTPYGTGAHIFTLTVEDANGCIGTATTSVDVNTVDGTISVSAPSPGVTTVCAGTPITFNASGNLGSGNYSYEFHRIRGAADDIVQANGPSSTYVATGVDAPIDGDEFYVVVNDIDTGCSDASSSITINVVSNPVPTLAITNNGGSSIICQDEALDFEVTPASFARYVFSINGNPIQDGAGNTFNYNGFNDGDKINVTAYTDLSASACFGTSSDITIQVNARPTPAIDGDKVVCANDTKTYTANVTGLGKGNYTWLISGGTPTGDLDDESVEVVWDGVLPYSVTLNYVNADGCESLTPAVEIITVNIVTAGLSADKSNICSGEDVFFTATGGDTYEFLLDGSTVQGPDPNDTYLASGLTDGQVVSVRAIDATGCEDTHVGIAITVNPLPTADISSSDADNTICEGDEVTFTGSGGDLYEFFINGTSVGAASAANTYVTNTLVDGDRVSVNVTNTTTTCSQMSVELVHTVNSLPTAGISADTGPNIITGTDVTFTATGGVQYEFFRNAVSVQGPNASDTYGPVNDLVDGDVISVVVYNANDCMASVSITMSVVDGITPYDLLSSATEYCEDEAGVSFYLATPQAGVSYRLIRTSDDQVINPIILFDGTNTVRWDDVTVPAALTTEEFRVEGFYPTVPGSEIEMNNRVTITRNNLPTVFSILPTGTVTGCGGGAGHEVKLENSETGVSYQLMLDGGNIGTPVVGNTGNEITFGFQTIFGDYTIMATNTTTGCSSLMSNTFTIEPDGTYTSFDVSGDGNFCVGDAGADVILEGSEVGVEYRVIRDGIEIGDTWIGDDSAHTFGPYTIEGSYSVVVNTATGCKFSMNGAVNVIEVALPKSYDLEATNNGHFCSGDMVTITISGQQNGVDYELFHNDVSVAIVTGTLDDDTAPLSLGDYGIAGTYRVEARTTGVICSAPMNNELILIEDDLPTVFNVTSDGDYCTGGTTFLHLDGSESDVQYRWEREGDLVTGPWVDGNGGVLDFEITGTDTYYIVAMRKDGVTSCTSEMTPRIAITEKVYADLTKVLSIKPGTGLDCNNGAVVIVEASETGVVYELVKSGVRTGNIVTGDGSDVEFPIPILDIAATYEVYADKDGCEQTLISTIYIDVPGALTQYAVTGSGDICNGDPGQQFGVAYGDNGVNYTLYLADGPGSSSGTAQQTVAGSDAPITFDLVNNPGEYYVMADDGAGCAIEMLNRETLIVHPLPIAYQISGSGKYCSTEAGAYIKLESSEVGVEYIVQMGGIQQGTRVSGSGSELTFGPFSTAGVYSVVAYNSTTLCTSNMNGEVTIGLDADIVNYDIINAELAYCEAEGGIDITLEGQQDGVTYQVFNLAMELQAEVVGDASGGQLSLGLMPEGTYTIIASYGGDGCVTQMNSGNAIAITSNSSPLSFNVVTTEFVNICQGTTINIELDGSEDTRVYNIVDELSNVVATATGDGNPLTISILCDEIGDNLYEVIAIGTPTCDLVLDIVRIAVKDAPLQPVVEPTIDMNYCWDAEGIKVSLTAVEAGIDYYIVDKATGNRISFLSGDAGVLEFKESVLAGTYYVTAKSFDSGCDINSLDFTVNAYSEIQKFRMQVGTSVGGFETIEDGEIGTGSINLDLIGLELSTVGVRYTLLRNNLPYSPDYVLDSGTGNPFQYTTALPVGGMYTILAEENGCSRLMAGSVNIFEKPLEAIDDILPVTYGQNVADTNVWFNDISLSSIDINVGPSKNIYFKLLGCDEEIDIDELVPWDSEAPLPKHTLDRNGNDMNLVEMYVDGTVVFTKLPSFYGRDSIDYVVYNTDYLGSNRYDRGRIYFFAGNINQAEDELLIPNAFSPNGDGFNDEFVISQFKSEPTESKLEVFNRWGTLVYRSKGKKYTENFWDGKSNAGMVSLGEDLPSGTYFYIFKVDISVVDEDTGSSKTVSKEYTGFIELRR